MIITSVNNDLIKNTAKLLKNKHREETGLFLIEGEKAVSEAILAGLKIEQIFVIQGYKHSFSGDIIETTEAVMSKISDAKTAPPTIAVAHQPKFTKNDFENYKKIILLEGIKDAGNLGTIIRTACAFGINGIILFGDTVDLYNPKTVRSAVGNLWKIPIIKAKDFEDLEHLLAKHERIATLPSSTNTTNLKEYKPAEKVVVMFGSEADGLSDKLKEFATKNVTIEMNSNVESLNLSISAGIIMYLLKE